MVTTHRLRRSPNICPVQGQTEASEVPFETRFLSFCHFSPPPPPPKSCVSLSVATTWDGSVRGGNDFFFLLLFLHRGRSESLVIRSFITLPARHSAVRGNAISPDSHNYPQIEREKWGWGGVNAEAWVRESLGGEEMQVWMEGIRKTGLFSPRCEGFRHHQRSKPFYKRAQLVLHVHASAPPTWSRLQVQPLHAHARVCVWVCVDRSFGTGRIPGLLKLGLGSEKNLRLTSC